MNAILDRAEAFIHEFILKPKKASDEEKLKIENEKVSTYEHLCKQAGKIVKFQSKCHMHLAVLPEYREETNQQVTAMELEVAEQVFFTLFNRLRVLHGFEPLKGKKFTGEYNYEAHVK